MIENPDERSRTLQQTWELCQKLLIVSAQILVSGRGNNQVEFSDGVLARRGTFQKFFTQAELREYIETVLGTEAIPAAPGVFYAFKNDTARQGFLATRYRRRPASSRQNPLQLRFDQHRELLEPLLAMVEILGRLPKQDEFELSGQVIQSMGSLNRAFALIRRVAGDDAWQATARARRDDLLVYLALGKFRRGPPIRLLPLSLQRDIKAFFGSYSNACVDADDLLFRSGNAEAVDLACRESKIGKLLPNALYVHRSALEALDPLLRVYEGCGRAFLGDVDEANIIKIHRFSGKLSYLVYPDFDEDPHPILLRSVKVSFRFQTIDSYDYSQNDNPPILHRKETFLECSHPLREKFARLTEQEERHGLLDETSHIGTRDGWRQRLLEAGMTLRGHRLIKAPHKSE